MTPHVSLFKALKNTYEKWSADKASQLGAALAFYATFSLAPLVLLIIKLCGFIYGEKAARGTIVSQIQNVVGTEIAQALSGLLETAHYDQNGTIATIISFIIMLFAASGMFTQLRDSLNTIWGVQLRPGRPIWTTVRTELRAFLMIAMCGILMLATLALSTAITAMATFLSDYMPGGELYLHLANAAFAFIVIAALVALIFKFASAAIISWHDALRGALFTSLLLTIGKFLLGFYLGRSGVTSAFGAAGSVILIILWVYYCAQIVFFGAEFTCVYSDLCGKHIQPSVQAIAVPKHA